MSDTIEKDPDPVLIDLPMPIVSPRLIIRDVRPGDGAIMAENTRTTHEQLVQWMHWVEKKKEEIKAENYEAVGRKKHAAFILREEMMMLAFARDDGRLVANTGLHDPDWKNRIFEIGYWVNLPDQGKGYATELAGALARYAFGALKASKVVLTHAEGNAASARVIEKLGFEREGVIRKKIRLNDRILDDYLYGLFDPDRLPPQDVNWGETT